MTRKRFIKLLMARGVQRNDAQERATHVKEVDSYLDLYLVFALNGGYFMGDFARCFDGFCKAISAAARSFSDFRRVAFGIDLANGPDRTSGGAE